MANNPRILIVDQDFETRAELQKGLARSRFVVVGGVGYGAEALSLASELHPQVILVGVEEPTARALQTIKALSEMLPDTPIIAHSTLTDVESARRAVVAGARDYLAHPLKIENVIAAIEMALAQQERRRAVLSGQPSPAAHPGGMVITLFGAKGGIGKTTIATNLATALVKINAGSAVLVDVDTVFGDAALMMDVSAESSLVEMAGQIGELDRETVRRHLARHHSGVYLLPAPLEPSDWRGIDPAAVEKVIDLLAQTHDFVIMDCPATLTDIVAVALEKATVILLITSLDLTSIRGTASALRLLGTDAGREEKVKLTVNHPSAANGLKEADVEKVLRRELFWSIPFDVEVSVSVQKGLPAVLDKPSSPVSQSIMEMASLLAGMGMGMGIGPFIPNGRREANGGGGLLRRLLRR